MTHLIALTDNFWQLFVISAPWLLLGLFIAGLIKVYLPKNFLMYGSASLKTFDFSFGVIVITFW